MSVFLVALAGLIALALVFVLPPLLRATRLPAADLAADAARRANLQVLREQLAALDAEHANGALDASQHQLARSEVERRALEEEQDVVRPAVANRAGKTAIALGAFVPLFVFVVYGGLGTPEALLPRSPAQAAANGNGDGAETGGVTAQQIDAMVSKLANRLENQTAPQPGDAEAWTMLARSYAVLQRFPEASRAFGRARGLAPDNAQLLADHADVLAMLQGQTVAGEPAKLVMRALEIDPRNLKALALAGSAAFERKDFSTALKFWGQAKSLAEPGSAFASGLDGSIQQAQAAGGQAPGAAPAVAMAPAPAVPAGPKPVVPQAAPNQAKAAAGASKVSGVVQLAGPLAAKAAPGDTLFVFARAAQGPRMPLAILKMRVSDLPLTFTLDDSSAMSPEMTLSKFPMVVVGARVSRSGDAMPRTGDLVGQVGPVETGSTKLTITIDSVQP
jgi:cytochrome c-type biogenesis protein CcmH